jgi:predicted transposase/invertase (TIGR01784 family)
MRPIFADPKTDFVFKRLFGTEEHKDLLIALLDALLELDGPHRIVAVELLAPEQRPVVSELKLSIVDVKCRDARGVTYVVEMQVLNVEGFEKRVVYNVAKAYISQLGKGRDYPELHDVIGVTICDFELWPAGHVEGVPPAVPMLSRWRMEEQHGGFKGLGQIQLVFLELPKFDTRRPPATVVEKWAYFFRETENLTVVPEVLTQHPYARALDAARSAGFTEEEWDAYIRAGMAIQDERGALSLAHKQGRDEGRKEGIDEGRKEGIDEGRKEGRLGEARSALRRVLSRRGLALRSEDEGRIDACADLATLERWLDEAIVAASAAEALR